MERIKRQEMYLEICKIISQRSTCLRRHVGCVITIDDRIVSTGYNGSIRGFPHCEPHTCNETTPCLHTMHAEANAIAFAAKETVSIKGGVLYCTAIPCQNCAKLIIQSGIQQVVFESGRSDTGGLQILKQGGVGIFEYTEDMFKFRPKYRVFDNTMHVSYPKGATIPRWEMDKLRKKEMILKLAEELIESDIVKIQTTEEIVNDEQTILHYNLKATVKEF